jgi:hypothetical protein
MNPISSNSGERNDPLPWAASHAPLVVMWQIIRTEA